MLCSCYAHVWLVSGYCKVEMSGRSCVPVRPNIFVRVRFLKCINTVLLKLITLRIDLFSQLNNRLGNVIKRGLVGFQKFKTELKTKHSDYDSRSNALTFSCLIYFYHQSFLTNTGQLACSVLLFSQTDWGIHAILKIPRGKREEWRQSASQRAMRAMPKQAHAAENPIDW